MLDFPANPTIGQVFASGGVTWTWDGVKWTAAGTGTGIYLPLTGGTMTGDLILNRDAQVALGAATFEQVDARGAGDNRIINGDMRIDQRNNGASGTASGYTVDRWAYGTNVASKIVWQRVSGPAASGFPYCLMATSSSAYSSAAADGFALYQPIEADMVSDFAWGTAGAQPATLSFWAGSNLAGAFSGVIRNYAGTRSYPFSFTLPAGPWTKITIPIPGDTAGTWVMSGNAGSMYVFFDLGSGASNRGPANAWASANYNGVTGAVSIVATNGAAFYVTGVKLEIGSVATPFNRQSLAKSMADCQRYYQKLGGGGADIILEGYSGAANVALAITIGIAAMRAAPTASLIGAWTNSNASTPNLFPGGSTLGINVSAIGAGAVTFYTKDSTTYITLDAEL